jgi:hypothetical protein
MVEAVDAIQKAGFPRPIGSDHGEDFSGPDFQVHIMEGLKPAEFQGETLDLNHGFPGMLRHRTSRHAGKSD